MIRSTMLTRTRRSKASVMLEFALILPLALAIMLFTVDMGRLVLLSTGLHDSAAVAARAGARQGLVGTDSSGPAFNAFTEASQVVPGLATSTFEVNSPRTIPAGGGGNFWCTPNDQYVRVTGKADISFITPGLGALLSMVGSVDPSSVPSSVSISSTGVARCEVIR